MKKDQSVAIRTSVITMTANAVLTVFKLAVGIIAHSGALVSDAVHSASDVVSTVIVMIGIGASRKKSDSDHPYGHDRLENVASLLLSVLLFITGAAIGYSALQKMITGSYADGVVPGTAAIIAAIVSIAVKEWMYRYTKAVALREKHTSLLADAWHHRSDALSSVGALIGVGMARMGFPIFDPLAGFVICVFIVKAALDIFRDACDGMVDKSASPDMESEIRRTALTVEGVHGVDRLATRRFGSGCYVDIEIAVDGNMTLSDAHAISETVHDALEGAFPDIKHCMVHVNPYRM